MANTIMLPDGRIETVFNKSEFLNLVDEFMGYDACRWLEEWMEEESGDSAYLGSLESELEGVKEHYREVMNELRTHSEKLAGLIREKDLDRRAISETTGKIGLITWREANR